VVRRDFEGDQSVERSDVPSNGSEIWVTRDASLCETQSKRTHHAAIRVVVETENADLTCNEEEILVGTYHGGRRRCWRRREARGHQRRRGGREG